MIFYFLTYIYIHKSAQRKVKTDKCWLQYTIFDMQCNFPGFLLSIIRATEHNKGEWKRFLMTNERNKYSSRLYSAEQYKISCQFNVPYKPHINKAMKWMSSSIITSTSTAIIIILYTFHQSKLHPLLWLLCWLWILFCLHCYHSMPFSVSESEMGSWWWRDALTA